MWKTLVANQVAPCSPCKRRKQFPPFQKLCALIHDHVKIRRHAQESRVRDWSNRNPQQSVNFEILRKSWRKIHETHQVPRWYEEPDQQLRMTWPIVVEGGDRHAFRLQNRYMLLRIGLTVARPVNVPAFTQIVEVDRWCRERSDNVIFRKRKRKRNVGVFTTDMRWLFTILIYVRPCEL